MALFWNLLSALLIVATIISYIPQYQLLLTVGSSAGLSVARVFIMTMVAQVQMATMYYLFRSAPDMIDGIPINTPPSPRDWLNLAQIFSQWICSLILYVEGKRSLCVSCRLNKEFQQLRTGPLSSHLNHEACT